MSDEIVKKESSEVAVYSDKFMMEHADSRDILLPKILLMQGLSKKVAAEQARQGEMRDSLENKLLGSKENAVECIPFWSNKTWILFQEKNGKLEYSGQVPVTPENANWEWDVVIDGVKWRRDQSLNFFVVLPSELKEGIFMPYIVSFRRTSYIAGKKLETAKEKLRIAKRPLVSKHFLLSSSQQKNDKGVFYVFDVAMSSTDTTQDELKQIEPWLDLVRTSQVRVDESDLRDEEGPEVVSTEQFKGDF